MLIGKRKGVLTLALALLLLFSSASAQAVSIREFAEGCLTEVLGYTEEEVKDFVFEEREGGVLAYWPKEHPSWVYTTVYKNNVPLESTTPFDTGYKEDWRDSEPEAGEYLTYPIPLWEVDLFYYVSGEDYARFVAGYMLDEDGNVLAERDPEARVFK